MHGALVIRAQVLVRVATPAMPLRLLCAIGRDSGLGPRSLGSARAVCLSAECVRALR